MLTEKCLDLPEKSCAILHRTELMVGVGNDYKSMRFAGSFQRDIHRVGLLKRDLLGIARLLLLAPQVWHRAHDEEQSRGTDQQYIPMIGIHEEVPVGGDGQHESGLNRHEQQHEIQILQTVECLIVLAAVSQSVQLE